MERTNARIYTEGNPWQQDRYAAMAAVNEKAGITRFGISTRGTPYKHLLQPQDALHNFLGDQRTLQAVQERFAGHKAGDLQRALTNMVASQPCCFNLFVPLQRDLSLASRLFSHLLRVPVTVEHIEIEFTPNTWVGLPGFVRHTDETIGDQSKIGGTDADVAVFYKTEHGERGVVMVEFKYIEAEFSICSSYKKKEHIRTGCDASNWYMQRVGPHLGNPSVKPDCGYLKYRNWQLLEQSTALDVAAVKALAGCPFKGSLNQLWRNMLLAERVAAARRLDEFHFWVLAPEQNTELWEEHGDVAARFRSLLTPAGIGAFRQIRLDRDVVSVLERMELKSDQRIGLERFRSRYL